MDDKATLIFTTALGISPASTVALAYRFGVRSYWLLMLALLLGAVVGFVILTFVGEEHFDEQGKLKSRHRKLIVRSAEILCLVAICAVAVIIPSRD